jgi:uncharacterized membrane protein YhaH (DUF805 family)
LLLPPAPAGEFYPKFTPRLMWILHRAFIMFITMNAYMIVAFLTVTSSLSAMDAATLVMTLTCLAGGLFAAALQIKRYRDEAKRRDLTRKSPPKLS